MKLPRIFTIAGVAISFADLSHVRPLGWCQWVQAAAGQRAMGRTRTSSLTLWGRDSRERLAQGRSSFKAERLHRERTRHLVHGLAHRLEDPGWNPGIRFACGRTENCWSRSTVLLNPIQFMLGIKTVT